MSSLGKSLLYVAVAVAVLVTVAVMSDGVAHRIVVLLLIATAATTAGAAGVAPPRASPKSGSSQMTV